MKTAATYLRSSKDRHDVSIDSQRRELKVLAAQKGLTIVHEYVDIVESAKTEFRPAFQELIRDIKSPSRDWGTLLSTDTSRLSRRRYLAQIFKRDAEKHGVKILYAKMPEVDPLTNVILESIMEAMDEYHSLMSREKGLAGMAENVRQGFRAGGRAPSGYELEYIDTGALRDGESVRKSRLKPSEQAPEIAAYLKRRAQGEPRAIVRRDLGLTLAPTTLIGMEWNALTYAGHTVWNVHAERIDGAYKGGSKRRPRSEWKITRSTHEPLITDSEAEILLEGLQNSSIGKAVSRAKAEASAYLLTPLLQTPSGRNWRGQCQQYYRLDGKNGERGRKVPLKALEGALLTQLMADTQSPKFIRALVSEAHRAARQDDPAKPLRRQTVELNKKISRASELSVQLEDPGPMLRKIDEYERSRKLLTEQIAEIDKESTVRKLMAEITEKQVSALIREAIEPRALLKSVVNRITLDPENLECQVHYQVPGCVTVASPRGFEPLLPP